MSNSRIPITIFNGFLGAGKTTIILNLLNQLDAANPETAQGDQNSVQNNAPTSTNQITNGDIAPDSGLTFNKDKKYNVVWIKNEFGVNEVDSVLAQQSSIASVTEITNGCLCCTLVGRLSDSLYEILIDQGIKCDRVIIETSGSAFPTSLVQEINRVSFQNDNNPKVLLKGRSIDESIDPNTQTTQTITKPTQSESSQIESSSDIQTYRPALPVYIDGVICVVDALNYYEYSDTSFTAKIQAQYTDLILLNKHELITEASHASNKNNQLDDKVGESGLIDAQQCTIDNLKDLLLELAPETQIVKTDRGWINYQVVFGLDSALWTRDHGAIVSDASSHALDPLSAQTSSKVPDGLQDVDVLHLEWVTRVEKGGMPQNLAHNPLGLAAFEKFLTQLHLFNCIRAKGIVLIEMTLEQYQIIQTNQNSRQATGQSASNLLSEKVSPCTAQPDRVVAPIILNWALGRWSYYPLPQFDLVINESLAGSGQIINSNLPSLIFSPSSLYVEPHMVPLDHEKYDYAHSRLTLFGAAGNIATFSFQKMIMRHVPVVIRKQCCVETKHLHDKEHNHATCAKELHFGGFVTVLSKEHSHNHNH